MHTTSPPAMPFVSVIVPVYNSPYAIRACIEALLAQTYPRQRYEIIVVDNNSSDATPRVVRGYPVMLLVEDRLRGSYAARNRGIAHAHGQILAFTDADCIPVPDWITEGVAALEEAQAALAGGRIRFCYSARPSSAEICDSLFNLQMATIVLQNKTAVTANLFARASLVQSLGLFPADLRSGGDVFWTGQAAARGYRLVYAPQAEVIHPARQLHELLHKQYRVGQGLYELRARRRTVGDSPSTAPRRRIAKLLSTVLPPSIVEVRQRIRQQQIELSVVQLGLSKPTRISSVSPCLRGEKLLLAWQVWLVAWLCRLATTLGNLSMCLQRKRKMIWHIHWAVGR